MITHAAITYSKGAEFQIDQIELDNPKKGEVLVKIVASGICHTDMNVRNQQKPFPLPAVLGHEGAGVIEKVGEGVTYVVPGDHVVMSYSSCGHCDNCKNQADYACTESFKLNFTGVMGDGTTRIHQHGKEISTFFGQSSFSAYSVVSERNIVKVDKDIPLEILAPLGCGIQTGSGVVLNKLKAKNGSSVAIFGCGTVGLSAIMAAKIAGCSTIIGIDIHSSRLELARELGATHIINSIETDVKKELEYISRKGIDYAIDTSGVPDVFKTAFESLALSGKLVLVGGTPFGTEVNIDMNHLLYERTIMGALQGNSIPKIFIPKLIEYYKMGRFPFSKLFKYYEFRDINTAFEDMKVGKAIKAILIM